MPARWWHERPCRARRAQPAQARQGARGEGEEQGQCGDVGCVCCGGHVTDLHFTVSHRQPKLIAIDKQPDDDVMHLNRFGKAHRLPRETLLRVRKVRGLRSIFCVFRLPTNDHISSTSTSSARQIMTSPSLEDKAVTLQIKPHRFLHLISHKEVIRLPQLRVPLAPPPPLPE